MFYAKDLVTGKIVWAWEVSPDEDDGSRFVDPYTGEEMFLRTMHYRDNGRIFVRSHFVHKSTGWERKDFLDAYDNYPHWLAVEHFYKQLVANYGSENVSIGWSEHIPSPFKEGQTVRYPDIVVKDLDKIIAIEVQRSKITMKKFRERNRDYSFAGVYVIWLFDRYVGKMKKIWNRVFRVWDKIYFYEIPRGSDGDLDPSGIRLYVYKDGKKYSAWLPDGKKYHFMTYATKMKDFTWLRAHIPVSYRRPLDF